MKEALKDSVNMGVDGYVDYLLFIFCTLNEIRYLIGIIAIPGTVIRE